MLWVMDAVGNDVCGHFGGLTKTIQRKKTQAGSNIKLSTPRKINMEPDRIYPWKRKIIFQTMIFRFYVNLRGVF